VSDTTEPAIPVIAMLPPQAHRDLTDLVEMEFASLPQPGLRFSAVVTETKDAQFRAVVTVVRGLDIAWAVTRSATGRWSGAGYVQWVFDPD
jgi:hypothetical protein